MERDILGKLKEWKNSPYRKPLIMLGARQVGKTYILKQFAKEEYENVAYINCDNNPQVQNLFEEDFDMQRVLLLLSAITRQKINPGKTLIILDEIQELPRGISSLKYFCEELPLYHVAVAGSLLGISLHGGESAPVGKVNIIRMYPMSFYEYLQARGEDGIYNILMSGDWKSIGVLHQQLVKLLREYYFVGGMPEAVKRFVETNDVNTVRQVQKEILFLYQNDMSKHLTNSESARIRQVWQIIPSQLARENKKFVFGAIKTGARAKDYEMAIQWLVDAGLVYRITKVNAAKMPLKFYEDISAFKLFLLDVGLLGALCEMTPLQMLESNNIMAESKGAFSENYLLAQLETINDMHIYYYSREDSKLEVDFMVQYNDKILPIEVKAEENLRSKSLRSFINSNQHLKGSRFSMSMYIDQEWMENFPLYIAAGINIFL